MTPSDRLGEIRERCEKASKGPWVRNWDEKEAIELWTESFSHRICTTGDISHSPSCYEQGKDDMELLEHSREDIPYLLDLLSAREKEVERLKSGIKEAEKAMESVLAHDCENGVGGEEATIRQMLSPSLARLRDIGAAE